MADILFLSRGHGFGHAARDLRIIRALEERPGVSVRVMATGSAVAYYKMRGVECIPVDVADDDIGEGAAKTLWSALAAVPRPDLVVSDEVMYALPFARTVWHRPCVMLVCALWADYGMPDGDRFYDAADEVLILDFPRPACGGFGTSAPVDFLGPVVAPFPASRAEARERLGIGEHEFVGVLGLGGMNTRPESRRMASAAVGSWSAHAPADSRLLVLADRPDPPDDGAATVHWPGVTNEPETYYRAADVVFGDAMGSAICDLAWNRVPTVALLDAESAGSFPAAFGDRIQALTAAGLIETAAVHEGHAAVWAAAQRARSGSAGRLRPDADAGFRWGSGAAVAARLLDRLGTGSGRESAG